MKRFFYLLVAMCAMAFVGCSDDDDNGGEDNSKSKIVIEVSGEENVAIFIHTSKPGEIITVDWGDGNVEKYKSAEEIEEDYSGHLEFSDYPLKIFYKYANKTKHTITVEGENIVQFACGEGVFSLDITCKSLLYLDCQGENLTTLDLTKCPALMGLHCPENNLTTLNVSKCTALEVIWCYDNNLSSLDVSKCTALMTLNCSNNNLGVSALNKIYKDLPKAPQSNNDGSGCIGCIDASYNPGYEASNKQIAIDKGWEFWGN